MADLFIERLLRSAIRNRHLDRFAMRALVRANELLGTALGVRLAELRDSGNASWRVFAEAEASAVYAKRIWTGWACSRVGASR